MKNLAIQNKGIYSAFLLLNNMFILLSKFYEDLYWLESQLARNDIRSLNYKSVLLEARYFCPFVNRPLHPPVQEDGGHKFFAPFDLHALVLLCFVCP